jgi:hypothetical protein
LAARVFRLAAALLVAAASHAYARGGGGCLREGTRVETPRGAVAIERLSAGDPVVVFEKGGFREGRVVATTRIEAGETIELSFPGGAVVATATHPFATGTGVFRAAGGIQPGDFLLLRDGNGFRRVPVLSVRRISGEAVAYDLLVDRGGVFLASGVLVHNKGCFLPDTPILLPGGRSKPIREIGPGDRVLAFQEDGTVVDSLVREIHSVEADGHYAITTSRSELRATAGHPFLAGGGTYKTVEALAEGDTVYAFDGRRLSPQTIRRIVEVPGKIRAYNLRTDPPNTFFASGVADHNKGGGGGGGGSRSSGSSRSSGGTSIGKEGAIVFFIVFGAFTAIILYALVRHGREKKRGDLDYLFGRGVIERKARRTRKVLEFLARQEASADPARLEARVREVFQKLQECWQAREYGPMENLLVPFLYQEHCRQLAGMRANHEINMLEDLSVESIDFVHVSWTDKPDRREFTVLITARVRDWYKDDRSGTFLRGDREPARFQEFWTFQYRSGAWLLLEIEQTRESDRLKKEDSVESFTDLQLEQIAGKPSGDLGPAGPWSEKETERKAGKIERLLNFLVRTDRIWDREGMLATARQGFSDLVLSREAEALSDEASARMFPDAAREFRKALEQQSREGLTVEYRNFCVRKVDLVLVRNFSDNARDNYLARVYAHAQRIVKRRGKVVHQDGDVVPFEEYLAFGRLDGRWKLQEVVPPAGGGGAVSQENLDEDSSLGQLRWYYSKKRAL